MSERPTSKTLADLNVKSWRIDVIGTVWAENDERITSHNLNRIRTLSFS